MNPKNFRKALQFLLRAKKEGSEVNVAFTFLKPGHSYVTESTVEKIDIDKRRPELTVCYLAGSYPKPETKILRAKDLRSLHITTRKDYS